MPADFVVATYCAGLQQLLDARSVPARVAVFDVDKRDFAKLGDGAIAEFGVEQFPCTPTGIARELRGVLSAYLLVMVQLKDDEAEARAFELALDVATALLTETDPELSSELQLPAVRGGPIMVTSVEPSPPDGALSVRVAAYMVRYDQDLLIRRLDQPTPPLAPVATLIGRPPNIGTGHEEDYRLPPPLDLE